MSMEEGDLKSQKSRSGGRYRPECKISNPKKSRIDDIEDNYLRRNGDYNEQSLEFAKAAICHLDSKEDVGVELVKPGLVEGAGISRGSIFHFNFEARSIDDPDGAVKTFFAQIRLMGDCPTELTMFIDCCVNLGPTNELPEEVYDGGCQYCTTLVYHPIGGCRKLLRCCVNDDVSWLYHNTDSGHFRPSWYKYREQFFLLRSRSGRRYSPARRFSDSKKNRVEETEDLISRRRKDHLEQSLEYAKAAVCHLNYKENLDFELMEQGLVGGAGISRGFIFHINFEAKWRGDPDDPVQTFFAQIRLMEDSLSGMTRLVDCCVNLGPTNELPDKVYDGGCQYCGASVYHPIGGCEKLLLGCENDDEQWLHEIYSDHFHPCNENLRRFVGISGSRFNPHACLR